MDSEDQRDHSIKEFVHKTKFVQFLGRTTPIILQNDNGPCPLLAICNVLLLRNNLSLSPKIIDISQEKLLSLVAERLIDSNINVNNKDAGFVENQQQNIADAIDLLPRLATGIDVNIKFKRINDFEFTRESAIFDLLDIPLYHGWIVDSQDNDTANAIGSKSYNGLMGELVALETRNVKDECKDPEEDSVDFVAATTATLGVPSPSFSRGISVYDSPCADSDHQIFRKGDFEEEIELLRVLNMSKAELSIPLHDSLAVNSCEDNVTNESICPEIFSFAPVNPVHTIDGQASCEKIESQQPGSSILGDQNASQNRVNNLISFGSISSDEACSSSKTVETGRIDQLSAESGEASPCNDGTVDISELPESQTALCSSNDSISSMTKDHGLDIPESHYSSVDCCEPIYEGEECIVDSSFFVSEDREPIKLVLGEQSGKGSIDVTVSLKDEITAREGELIRSFLRVSANQLTVYGLLCLQDGLKERELCVFFRNNHFSTMFKLDGELYLLATDQGYINQPDLVWEKLNEVNGNTVLMTSNFKEFKIENQADATWDEQNSLASTAEYLASIDHLAQPGSNYCSDLELAIALQQQEYGQQAQCQAQQPSEIGSSSLVTGPQVQKNARPVPTRPEPKSKDSKEKCIVM